MFQLSVGTFALCFSSTACSTRATHSRREVKHNETSSRSHRCSARARVRSRSSIACSASAVVLGARWQVALEAHGKARQAILNQEVQLEKEDKMILGFALAALGYFAAHVAWALMKPWIIITSNAMK